MKKLIVLLLFIYGTTVAFCQDSKKATQLSLGTFLSEKNYTAIKMKAVRTGHLIIKASINGVAGTFILDTGASHTVVIAQEKDTFHLKGKNTKNDAVGAGGKSKTIDSTGNTIHMGEIAKKNQHIIIMNLDHVINALSANGVTGISGVIGADCLKLYNGIIDYKNLVLYIK